MVTRMITKRNVFLLAFTAAAALGFTAQGSAQETIKIGELNSYKTQSAFLDPYKKGMELALEEVNGKGGVLGKKLELISRDDGTNPGEAVRVAEELITREGVSMIAGTFLSHIGLAVTNFAGQKKVFFLAAEPLTDKITWQNGNKYTYRLRATTYMQTAMLLPAALEAKKKRWALVYPDFEYGQSAVENFKALMKKSQPDIEFVTEQATPLGKVDAGAVAQAIDDAKPDAIFNVLFGPDLAKFVREGNTRGVFKNRVVVSLLSGEPEYLDPLKDEAPVGWTVTGYPWDKVKTPEHMAFVAAYQKKFNDYPRLGSIVGYSTIKSIAAGIAKAGSTDTEKMVAAFAGLKVDSPFGPFEYRASDHQATMGAYVGKIALENGKGTMSDFKYIDGATVLPSDAEVKKLRPAEAN
ncbi:ABC transporter substrate-binding protein [Rhodoplanes sp. Z2-YC6860]|uniref:ABC transporter substrate-binding protein n=1 Tax=Rhodoplanes sp. Z2-YC6860 TaxID=674703 RepID=UPI00078E0CE2|nr:ABC transporter substrate-binding protein [Rhodoplanes sp. Z2-YC6860]AMN43984.1 branched-chain amino acid ABC transporter substrate-binding protein [Rhodoplanes sp. Z2-YC6860]